MDFLQYFIGICQQCTDTRLCIQPVEALLPPKMANKKGKWDQGETDTAEPQVWLAGTWGEGVKGRWRHGAVAPDGLKGIGLCP